MLNFKKRIITFDIGGTNISGGVIEFGRKDYKFLDYFKTKNPKNSEKIKKILLDKSKSYKQKFKTKKIGISTAKIVNNQKKIVSQTISVYGKKFFDFDFLIKEKFFVEIENDGACFARGEYLFDQEKNISSLLTLTIGTEIGGGFVLNGEILKGKNGSAMEISHLKILKDKKWIRWCETASGIGIEKNYFLRTGEKVSSEKIFEMSQSGDTNSIISIEKATEFLGIGVANLINIFDPEKIVFGGGLSSQKKFLKQAIKISKKNIFNKQGKYQFKISKLGRKANQLGASSLFF